MMFKLTIDDRAMRRFLRTMPKAAPQSISRSLNKAINQTKTRAARAVSDARNITVGMAKEAMRVQPATPSRQEAMVIAQGEAIPVIKCRGPKRQTQRGVMVKITAKGKPHLYKGGFIAQMDSGHIGVFTRAGESTNKSKKSSPGTERSNLPIVEARLPSVASTMARKDIDKALREYAVPVFQAELHRLMDREMKNAGGK